MGVESSLVTRVRLDQRIDERMLGLRRRRQQLLRFKLQTIRMKRTRLFPAQMRRTVGRGTVRVDRPVLRADVERHTDCIVAIMISFGY